MPKDKGRRNSNGVLAPDLPTKPLMVKVSLPKELFECGFVSISCVPKWSVLEFMDKVIAKASAAAKEGVEAGALQYRLCRTTAEADTFLEDDTRLLGNFDPAELRGASAKRQLHLVVTQPKKKDTGSADAGSVGDDAAAAAAAPAGSEEAACAEGKKEGEQTMRTWALTNTIRGLVSKKKHRFKEEGFDLDLSYIGSRLLAMGFPSSKLEGMYRNKMSEVELFFETRHKGHFKVYNLCSEREYDMKAHFGGSCAKYPFDDHNACPLQLMRDFCEDAMSYLDQDPKNVVAVHCKAGKGRTGTLLCALLQRMGACSSAAEALEYYGKERTSDGKGVTIPSQRRYVHYYERLLRDFMKQSPEKPFPFEGLPLVITKITLRPFASLEEGKNAGCSPYPVLFDADKQELHNYKKLYPSVPEWRRDAPEHVIEVKIPVCGDAKLCIRDDSRSRKLKVKSKKVKGSAAMAKKKDPLLLRVWFHTAMIDPANPVMVLGKSELDEAIKDKKHHHFPKDFQCEITFAVRRATLPPSDPSSSSSSSSSSRVSTTSGAARSDLSGVGSSGEKTMGTKQGWLKKHGQGLIPWQRRYFRLCEGNLMYYTSPKDKKAKRSIPLDGYMAEVVEDAKLLKQLKRQGQLVLFRLTHSERKEYLLCAESETDLEEWLRAIMLEMFRDTFTILEVAPTAAATASTPALKTKEGLEEIRESQLPAEWAVELEVDAASTGKPMAAAATSDSDKKKKKNKKKKQKAKGGPPKYVKEQQEKSKEQEADEDDNKDQESSNKQETKTRSRTPSRLPPALATPAKQAPAESASTSTSKSKSKSTSTSTSTKTASAASAKPAVAAKPEATPKPSKASKPEKASTSTTSSKVKVSGRTSATKTVGKKGGKVQGMLQWAQSNTPGVDVTNFTKSWKDGLAWVALVENWRPDLLRVDDMRGKPSLEVHEKAFEAADEMGVVMLLEAEDASEIQDKKCTMMQVSQFYKALHHQPRKGQSSNELQTDDLPFEVGAAMAGVEAMKRRFDKLTDADIKSGKGAKLYSELKKLLPAIQKHRVAYLVELAATVELYNQLNQQIPARVNKVMKTHDAAAAGGISTSCARCNKPLGGETVEAIGQYFHLACFTCAGCDAPFTSSSCLNIRGKPFCDSCAPKAYGGN